MVFMELIIVGDLVSLLQAIKASGLFFRGLIQTEKFIFLFHAIWSLLGGDRKRNSNFE